MFWKNIDQELKKIASALQSVSAELEEMDDLTAGRKWQGGSGYGPEHSSEKLKGKGKWEPKQSLSGKNPDKCQGYRQGGTEACYDKDGTAKAGLPPVSLGNKAEKKKYNKAYREKRWPQIYGKG